MKSESKIGKTQGSRKASKHSHVRHNLRQVSPEHELLKSRLNAKVAEILEESGLIQAEIGKILGMPGPLVSLLKQNRTGRFSVGRLVDFLTLFGHDVEIRIRRTHKKRGEVTVIAERGDA
jgi:predicted XRE-type DNA-binding protein